jgi:hypothetical protein
MFRLIFEPFCLSGVKACFNPALKIHSLENFPNGLQIVANIFAPVGLGLH